MGVAKPESKIEGLIMINVPRLACCWVLARDEIKSPIPTMEETKTKRLRYKRNKLPVKGILKIKIAAKTIIVASARAIKIAGISLPSSISMGCNGDTRS